MGLGADIELGVGSIVSCITPAYSHVLFLLPGDRPVPSGKRNCLTHLKEHDRCGEKNLGECVCLVYTIPLVTENVCIILAKQYFLFYGMFCLVLLHLNLHS